MQLVLILLVEMGATSASIPMDITTVAGHFEQPASRCDSSADGSFEFCPAAAKDRLSIHRLTDDHARIIVHSYQEHGHECHVDGVANLLPAGLQYCLEHEPGTCLLLTEDAEGLRLKVTLDGAYYVPFCGSRASLDGLVFAKSARLGGGRCESKP